jgi:hypothetical protein
MGMGSTFEPEEYAEKTEAVVTAPTPLLVDDLITLLQGVRAAKGNLVVSINVFHDTEDPGGVYSIDPIVGHYFEVDDSKVAQKLVLCDLEHLEGALDHLDLSEEEVQPQGDN